MPSWCVRGQIHLYHSVALHSTQYSPQGLRWEPHFITTTLCLPVVLAVGTWYGQYKFLCSVTEFWRPVWRPCLAFCPECGNSRQVFVPFLWVPSLSCLVRSFLYVRYGVDILTAMAVAVLEITGCALVYYRCDKAVFVNVLQEVSKRFLWKCKWKCVSGFQRKIWTWIMQPHRFFFSLQVFG